VELEQQGHQGRLEQRVAPEGWDQRVSRERRGRQVQVVARVGLEGPVERGELVLQVQLEQPEERAVLAGLVAQEA